jgi:hypothetical protein
MKATYVDGTPMIDAYIDTLVCGYTRDKFPVKDVVASAADLQASYFQCVGDCHGSDNSILPTIMERFFPERAFFSTNEGFIGLGPSSAMVGDRICVVLGCQRLVLLHPLLGREGQFHLRGECNVSGLMHSQGLLGPLPETERGAHAWRAEYRLVEGNLRTVYTDGRNATQSDPRLSAVPLPSGWRFRFMDKADYLYYDEYSPSGAMRLLLFENRRKKKNKFYPTDPRMPSAELKKRGVDLQDLVIV